VPLGTDRDDINLWMTLRKSKVLLRI